jgi:hypothetical protein
MKRKSTQKLTTNQMAFKKELYRIKRFIRNARKRGYEFDDNVLPKQPKRITRKKLEEIKNIKPSNLYDKAVYYDKISQETFTGQQGRKIERYRANLKAKETRQKNKEIKINPVKIGETKEKKSAQSRQKKTKEKPAETKEKKSVDKKPTQSKQKAPNKKPAETKEKKQITNDSDTGSGTEYYPTVDVIDEIGERLVNIDYVMKKLTDDEPDEDYRYIWKRKSTVSDYSPAYFYSSIWLNTIQKYEEQNALSELEQYAKDNALEITNCIDVVYWASSKEEEGNWQRLSSKLVILLKGGEIPTLKEAQELGELQEQNELVSDSYED